MEKTISNTTLKSVVLTFALILISASAGIAGEPGTKLPLPADTRQELDMTMQWLKNAIESISITLIPVDPDDGNQYYSHYSFVNEGCSVKFSYDFNYFQRMANERKTTRIDSSFNLKDVGSLDVAPFYLTHIQTQIYSIYGKAFRIPVINSRFAEQIAGKLDQARRLCGAMTEKD